MARRHMNKRHVISFDIKDFFPSVTQKQIEDILPQYGVTSSAARTVSELCTFKYFLPQGGLTSPKVSNMVASHTFGPQIYELCQRHNLTMTLYADDITISGDNILGPAQEKDILQRTTDLAVSSFEELYAFYGSSDRDNVIEEIIEEVGCDAISFYFIERKVREILANHGFSLKPEKTKIMHESRRQTVCGTVVNDKVNLPRKQRLQLRAIVHNVVTNGVEHEVSKHEDEVTVETFIQSLKGRLNWFFQLNPEKAQPLIDKLNDYLHQREEDNKRLEQERQKDDYDEEALKKLNEDIQALDKAANALIL